MKTVMKTVTTGNIEWEAIKIDERRSCPPAYKADLGDTVYWICRQRYYKPHLLYMWLIKDNHGAAYGNFINVEKAMEFVERVRGYAR